MNSFASAPGGTDSLAEMMAQLDQQMAAPVRKVGASVPQLLVRSGFIAASSAMLCASCAQSRITDKSRTGFFKVPGLALQALICVSAVLLLKAVCRCWRRGRHGSSCPPLARWSALGTGSL